MKKQILFMSLILIATFVVAAGSTSAQTAYGVRADVPFDFIVGDTTIPAGRINAHGVSTAVSGALTIQNLDQGDLTQRAGRRVLGASTSDKCKLVFHKYGNRYYLAQIWLTGQQAWSVMKSKEESLESERRLVKNFKPTLVILAAEID